MRIKRVNVPQNVFNEMVSQIKSKFSSVDGYVYPINDEHSAGYIVQSNHFTFTDELGNITQVISR